MQVNVSGPFLFAFFFFCKGNRLRQQDVQTVWKDPHPRNMLWEPNKDWLLPVFRESFRESVGRHLLLAFGEEFAPLRQAEAGIPPAGSRQLRFISQPWLSPEVMLLQRLLLLGFHITAFMGRNYAYLLQHKYKYGKWESDCKWGKVTKPNKVEIKPLAFFKISLQQHSKE